MRRFLLVAAACMIAAPCLVSADVAAITSTKNIHHGMYDWATGKMMPADQNQRGGAPMWAAEFWDAQHPGTGYLTTSYSYSNGGFIAPGFVFAMDWGDLENAGDPARSVGSFDTGWVTNMTLYPSGATGLYLLLAWYKDYDGLVTVIQGGDFYEPEWITGFQWTTLPGHPGGPAAGGLTGWILPSGDLTNALPNDPNGPFDWSFSLDGLDLDSDGNADWGYAYYFIDTLDATVTGWWIGDDPNGDVGTTNDFFDYELFQDPNLDPNDPNAIFFGFSAWWWFGGTPYAQSFLRMWGTGETGCPAECSTSLDDDCDVDFNDLNILLSVYGGNPGHPADFTDPPGVDFNDLNVLLSQYGNNCDAP